MKIADISAVWPELQTVQLLGKGHYGTVYMCKTDDGNACAVKVVDIPPNDDAVTAAKKQGITDDMLKLYFDKFREDLNWEMSMYKPASGAGLAPVDDMRIEQDDDKPGWRAYIRTALYTPLAAYFGNARANESETVRMGIELCEAAEQLDRFGLIHGEINENNVMVGDDGHYVLTDFALRRCLDKAGAGLFPEHSDSYDAPEVKSYNVINKLSDIYSIGMVMCCTLCGGALPRNGLTGHGALGDIIRKATAYNQNERYESPQELKKALMGLDIAAAEIRTVSAVACAESVIKRNASIAASSARKKQTTAEDEARRKEEEEKRQKLSKILSIVAVIVIILAAAAILWILKPWNNRDNTVINGNQTAQGEASLSASDESGNIPQVTGKNDGSSENEDDAATSDQNSDSTEESADNGQTVISDDTDTNAADDNAQTAEETGADAAEGGVDGTVSAEIIPEAEQNVDEEDESSEDDPLIFPNVNSEYLTMEDLEGMDRSESQAALNELFALNGYIFKSSKLNKYYRSQSWYTPKYKTQNEATKHFNQYAKANYRLIIQYQDQMGYR